VGEHVMWLCKSGVLYLLNILSYSREMNKGIRNTDTHQHEQKAVLEGRSLIYHSNSTALLSPTATSVSCNTWSSASYDKFVIPFSINFSVNQNRDKKSHVSELVDHSILADE
jgi:hypothetical protein